MLKLFSKSVRRVGTAALLAPMLVLVGTSCTDLTETPHDALTPNNAFHSDKEILAGVAGVYATLRAVEWVGYITVEDLTTDVSIVPTRGSDWYDNGQWLDLHRQTWTANSSGTLAFLNGAWNDLFGAIAKENLMIGVIKKANAGAKGDSTLAELRTLRAFDYYMLQDMFGGVPLVASDSLAQYARVTRDSVFRFIESELLDARQNLPNTWPANYYGRVTKGTANAILASLYLNAGVFNDNGAVDAAAKASANSYNSCAGVAVTGGDACDQAIAAANAVISSGVYSLSAPGNWTENFSAQNKSSPENIFVVVHTADLAGAIGGNWPHRTLHYHQLNADGGPWNGFATTAENFARFQPTDERRAMWLFGPQRSFDNGQLVTDRAHNNGSDTLTAPLFFTSSIPDANAANEAQGVRFNKYPPTPNVPHGGSETNDFTFFRYSEIFLIKAEAENEKGDLAGAIADLATIHDRRDPANPVAGMGLASKQAVRDAILNERALELSAEGKRRTDMIRHGKFLSWTEASAGGVAATPRDAHLILFPIPAPQVASNPKLLQNAGYQ
jgi:starch-binding outer membrane protein, SusD/RagB family